ncbi:MAG: TetR/AcrR family transcriptional regulator [Hespellia sp.]|nr:TetR/AcrR family transcriptional regulator [Hespellia sp.]
MANQIEGVTEQLLRCAAKEFFEKGYADASLRRISEAANTSTSSIYVRFGDKAGLFSAIVDGACDDFLEMCEEEIETFNKNNSEMPFDDMISYKMGMMNRILDSIFDHFEAFKLLSTKAESSAFSNFIHRIAELEATQTQLYIQAIHNDALESGRLSLSLLQTLATAYWTGVFEIVVRNMDREEAKTYLLQLKRFFRCGWKDLFTPLP